MSQSRPGSKDDLKVATGTGVSNGTEPSTAEDESARLAHFLSQQAPSAAPVAGTESKEPAAPGKCAAVGKTLKKAGSKVASFVGQEVTMVYKSGEVIVVEYDEEGNDIAAEGKPAKLAASVGNNTFEGGIVVVRDNRITQAIRLVGAGLSAVAARSMLKSTDWARNAFRAMSDHTQGVVGPHLAVAVGAKVLVDGGFSTLVVTKEEGFARKLYAATHEFVIKPAAGAAACYYTCADSSMNKDAALELGAIASQAAMYCADVISLNGFRRAGAGAKRIYSALSTISCKRKQAADTDNSRVSEAADDALNHDGLEAGTGAGAAKPVEAQKGAGIFSCFSKCCGKKAQQEQVQNAGAKEGLLAGGDESKKSPRLS